MWKRLLPFVGLLLIAGCSYLNKPFMLEEPVSITDKYALGVVEFDDQGWFFDRQQAREVLESVHETATGKQSVIVVFVHGWHHNARSCDQNLACFRKTLERLHDEANLKPYQDTRRDMGAKSEKLQVIGIYLGWRGRSLPGKLTFATFWSRKNAGHRAGGADVREFLIRLAALHRQLNEANYRDQSAGLVTIGHSFGGAVLENALSPVLLRPLAENVPITGTRDLRQPGSAGAAVYGSSEPREQRRILEGFGDLVVLVNPAYEASLHQSFHELAQRARYSPCQAPILMVLSAENDFPRNRLFPIGRHFSLLRQATRDDLQRSAAVTALGNFKPQWTHQLLPEVQEPTAPRASGSCTNGNGVCHADLDLTDKEREDRARKLQEIMNMLKATNYDPRVIKLAEPAPIRGLVLKPIPGRNVDPNLPFLVVRAPKALINNHSGFFNNRLVGFLISYIGAVQTKKLLVARRPDLCGAEEQTKAELELREETLFTMERRP